MNSEITIRMATTGDVDDLLRIYAPYVIDTDITFEYEVPSRDEFKKRIETILQVYPYLVALHGDKIVGYAYASRYKTRAAYQWNVETSIYVDRECRANGIGSSLYEKMMKLLKKQNVRNVYACISLPNERSEKIHEKFGFQLIGTFHETGYKHGSWHDIGWFEKRMEYSNAVPEPIIPITEIPFV